MSREREEVIEALAMELKEVYHSERFDSINNRWRAVARFIDSKLTLANRRITAAENTRDMDKSRADVLRDAIHSCMDRITALESKLRAEVDERKAESKVVHGVLDSHTQKISGSNSAFETALLRRKSQIDELEKKYHELVQGVAVARNDAFLISTRLSGHKASEDQRCREIEDRLRGAEFKLEQTEKLIAEAVSKHNGLKKIVEHNARQAAKRSVDPFFDSLVSAKCAGESNPQILES